MSLTSMTGFGSAEASAKGVHVIVELSTVNRKQLDLHVSLPRSLTALESRIHDEIRHALSRGRVTGAILVTWSESHRHRAVEVDAELARAYLREMRKASRALKLTDDLTASDMMALPGVVERKQPDQDLDAIWPLVQRTLRRALKNLVSMRQAEGERLAGDLAKRIRHLQTKRNQIARRAPHITRQYRKQLTKRLDAAGLDIDPDDEKLVKEIALFAEKADISEELTRLDSHLQQAEALFDSREPCGRPMDFIAQELFREINTIGSKANDATVTRHVVDFKAELERFREQVQNVE